jgi:hypothetical protein
MRVDMERELEEVRREVAHKQGVLAAQLQSRREEEALARLQHAADLRLAELQVPYATLLAPSLLSSTSVRPLCDSQFRPCCRVQSRVRACCLSAGCRPLNPWPLCSVPVGGQADRSLHERWLASNPRHA